MSRPESVVDAEEVVFSTYMNLLREGARVLERAEESIKKFLVSAERLIELCKVINAVFVESTPQVREKLGSRALILYDNTLAFPIAFKKLREGVYTLYAQPPLYPHFAVAATLVTAYGLTPAILIRAEPLLTEHVVFVEGEIDEAAVEAVISGISVLGGYIEAKMNAFPLPEWAVRLPVRGNGELYLTEHGFSTSPDIGNAGKTWAKVTFQVPQISREVLDMIKPEPLCTAVAKLMQTQGAL